MMVTDLMRDPGNALPEPLRASIISVGLSVQREMDQEAAGFRFPDRDQRKHRRRPGRAALIR